MSDFKNQSPWGSPPGGGNGNGGFRRGPTPPNIDEIIQKIQDGIKKFLPGGATSGGKPIVFGLVVLLVIWALSGLYRVLPDEQGVVLRFGKFVKTTQPGLNYHIPFPVESVLTPKVTKVNRMDIGFRSEIDTGFGASGVADKDAKIASFQYIDALSAIVGIATGRKRNERTPTKVALPTRKWSKPAASGRQAAPTTSGVGGLPEWSEVSKHINMVFHDA